MKRLAISAAALALLGCTDEAAPREQWRVTLTTDATIPQFGDRVLMEILRTDGTLACPGCRRVLDGSRPEAWPLSFGVVPPDSSDGLIVRARLVRAIYAGADGLPAGPLLIDRSGFLPPGHGDAVLELPMSCFGVGDADPLTTCDPGGSGLVPISELPPSAPPLTPGTWGPAVPRPCPEPTPDKMVCIPGGAFLLGAFDAPLAIATPGGEATPERLVRVSPFFLDIDEVTVGDVRAAAAALPNTPDTAPPGSDVRVSCTYRSDGANDAWPVNCIDQPLAEAFCEQRGGRLPTEAEWEFAAVGRDAEAPFPWGTDDDVCAHAVIAYGDKGSAGQDTSCLGSDVATDKGIHVGGSDDDVTPQGVRNLGGNLQEWIFDDFAPYSDPCWKEGPGLLEDPWCQAGGNDASLRGGGWKDARAIARSTWRGFNPRPLRDVGSGFRCAKPATP